MNIRSLKKVSSELSKQQCRSVHWKVISQSIITKLHLGCYTSELVIYKWCIYNFNKPSSVIMQTTDQLFGDILRYIAISTEQGIFQDNATVLITWTLSTAIYFVFYPFMPSALLCFVLFFLFGFYGPARLFHSF